MILHAVAGCYITTIFLNVFLWRLTFKSVNLVHWREKKALLKHVLVVQHYKIWTFQKLNQGAVTASPSYRMSPVLAHWMGILNTLTSILCRHQTVGEVTQGLDNLLLVPCTSQIVFSFVYCLLCPVAVHCYSWSWSVLLWQHLDVWWCLSHHSKEVSSRLVICFPHFPSHETICADAWT